MATARRQRFLLGQAAWMLVTIIVLASLSALSLDVFFVVSLIGFLVLVTVTEPVDLVPRWRRRAKWIVLLGLVVFTILVFWQVMSILSSVQM